MFFSGVKSFGRALTAQNIHSQMHPPKKKMPTCVSLAPVSRIVSFADTGPLVLKSAIVECECNWVSEN